MIPSALPVLLLAGAVIIGWLVAEWRAARLYWRIGLGVVSIVALTAFFSLHSYISAYYVDWNHRQSVHLMVQLLEQDANEQLRDSLVTFLEEEPGRDPLAAASRLNARLNETNAQLRHKGG